MLGAALDPWQVEALDGLIQHRRAALYGACGVGKDALAAMTALWMLGTRPYCKGQITGPSKEQLFDILWSELQKWIQASPILSQLVVWEKSHVRWREHPERWFLSARTAKKQVSTATGDRASEGIQGFHEEHVLVVITEASGVEDSNFEAAESCCTKADNYLLVVGNPLRRAGRFYEIDTAPAFRSWYRRHIPYWDASHVDQALIERWREQYGEDSAFFQARALARFPQAGQGDTAIPWDLVMQAMGREDPLGPWDEGLQLGVDVGRFGESEATIAIRVGARIAEVRAFRKMKSPQLVGHIEEAVRDYDGDHETLIVIDEAGLGGGSVVDPLQQHGYAQAIGAHNNMVPRDATRYDQWDDEQWLDVMPGFFQVGTLPEDQILLAQLTTRRWTFTGKTEQQKQLESKRAMRSRGLVSPDRAEAVMLAIAEVDRDLPVRTFGGAGLVRPSAEAGAPNPWLGVYETALARLWGMGEEER